jgi:hypothetical protein
LSTDVSEVRAASIIIALMMEAENTSETSVDNYFTWQYIREDKSEQHHFGPNGAGVLKHTALCFKGNIPVFMSFYSLVKHL